MNRRSARIVLFPACVALIAPAAMADVEWLGTGDAQSLFQEANWFDNIAQSVPGANTINPNVAVNMAMVVHSGTPGGPNGASGNLDLGENGSWFMDGGTLRFDLIFQSGLGIRNSGTGDATGHPTVTLQGNCVAIMKYLIDVGVTLGGTAELRLNDAVDPLVGSEINLTSAGAKIHFFNRTVAQVIAPAGGHLGEILVNGQAPVLGADPSAAEPGDTLMVYSDGTTGCYVQIPPPPPCPADYDHNGAIEPADIAAFVNAWFQALSGGC